MVTRRKTITKRGRLLLLLELDDNDKEEDNDKAEEGCYFCWKQCHHVEMGVFWSFSRSKKIKRTINLCGKSVGLLVVLLCQKQKN